MPLLLHGFVCIAMLASAAATTCQEAGTCQALEDTNIMLQTPVRHHSHVDEVTEVEDADEKDDDAEVTEVETNAEEEAVETEEAEEEESEEEDLEEEEAARGVGETLWSEDFETLKKGPSSWVRSDYESKLGCTTCSSKKCAAIETGFDSKGMLKVTYIPSPLDKLSGTPGVKGVCSPTPIMGSSKYKIKGTKEATYSYRVYFADGFDFGRGAKLGMGFRGGKGTTGCKPIVPNGWSARTMWRTEGRLEMYLYHAGRKNACGDTFKAKWGDGSEFMFATGRWYTVSQSVTVNDPVDAANGNSKLYVDGVLMATAENLQWRGVEEDGYTLINKMIFGTFYGGKDKSWQPSKETTAYYDDAKVVDGALSAFCALGKKNWSKCCPASKQWCKPTKPCVSFADLDCKIPKAPTENVL